MKNNVLNILKKTGALLTDDHFVYTTGKHGSVYINKDIMYIHTDKASQVGKLFAEKCKNINMDIVAAPAFGGIVLSQWTAYHLSKVKKQAIQSIYTEKTPDNQQVLKRGYDKLVKDKKVLIVEDLTTTGSSVNKVINCIKNAGGKTIAVAVMVNRSPEEAVVNSKTFGGIRFISLDRLVTKVYEPKSCPLCKSNVPINTTVGHGKKFLEGKH